MIHGADLPPERAQQCHRAISRNDGPALWLGAALVLLASSGAAWGRGLYQTPRDFVSEMFDQDPPAASVLWITAELREPIREILVDSLGRLRLRYWKDGDRTVWVLDAIGKDEPITFGLTVARGRLQQVRVLEFRESRGGEVRHPFFTDQFIGATLESTGRLDRPIDGISGATLSVRALTRLARLALFLDQQVSSTDDTP